MLSHLLADIEALRAENGRLQQQLATCQQIQTTLEAQEAQHRAFLRAIPDLILQFDGDGTILGYEPSKELSPFVPPSEFLQKNVRDILPSDIANSMMEHVKRALQTGNSQLLEYQLPVKNVLRNYEARIVACGKNEVLSIVRDITNRKWSEQRAIRAERLATLGLMAAALAHEINNPLQIIQSHLDLLFDFSLETAEKERYINIVRHQIERLHATTRRVLNFARPKPAPRQRVSVIRTMRQILVLASTQLHRKDIQVTTDVPSVVPPVLASPDQLEQVLLNLVINAIEQMPAKGHLRIAIYEENNQVVISVISNSPPIPSEVLPHIFEAFFTTKPGGSGLGLWISHGLIQQHEGSLTAENLPDGVMFTVRLPCVVGN